MINNLVMNNDASETTVNETFIESNNSAIYEEYIFDRVEVKIIFITLYSIVFFCCFFGNLMVILVVKYSRRLKSVTNFFLANLAIADLCVSIFCIYQTLTNYLMNSWQLGDFLCKVYMFVQSLSYSASIMILVVVCIERYLAIVHPIKCRLILTKRRLKIIIVTVWSLAAIYAAPRLIFVETIYHKLYTGEIDVICIGTLRKHNKTLLDIVNLILLYLFPLFLMCCLYTQIAVTLWRSGNNFDESVGFLAKSRDEQTHPIYSSNIRNMIQTRRGVIRMLIAVVIMFGICNLPQQARIAWLHWDPNYYNKSQDFNTILTVSTFLISYMTSCLNPILYAFLSRNFRKGMRELLSFSPAYIQTRNPIECIQQNNHGIRHNGSTAQISLTMHDFCSTQTISLN